MKLWIKAIVFVASILMLQASYSAEYTIPMMSDHSGQFADLSKSLMWRAKVVEWWNDTRGKELNLKLKVIDYDTRYDPSVVASIWPRILSDHKPILVLGLGGPDQAALTERLSNDKVPMLATAPGYGYTWLRDHNQWAFNPRSSYVHEWMTALKWFIEQHPEKRPVRVGIMTAQAVAGYVDIANGISKYVNDKLAPQGLAVVAEKIWIDVQPVDLSTQMKQLKAAKVDIIFGVLNTSMAVATIRAQQMLGVNIPTMSWAWQTILPVGRSMKTLAPWEGHITIDSAVPVTDKSGQAWRFYSELSKKYGLPAEWDPFLMLGLSQTILALRAIEHTAVRVGADNVTGQAVAETLRNDEFNEDELMGIFKGVKLSDKAPFALSSWIRLTTVKDGKYTEVTGDWLPIVTNVDRW